MNTKVLLAALAGAVTTFLTGWLIYGIALKGFFEAQMVESAKGVMRTEPGMLYIFLGCLSWSLLLALLYSRWAGITTLKSGAIAGAWISFLIALGANLFSYASMDAFQFPSVVVDALVNAVQGALAGGVIGAVLGYQAKQ
ncbi:MAG: hypothetical protein IPL27_04370 [Lewinellaceae bacterium]|nr:hypothetical protein [Lewinellaceae bacterium]